mmetsp:Transcript_13915/g.25656  ORF Transcript_13915/g.25656 Transcript_13915/m.25656 type:complete len:185 (-) Transcript_13915:4-558(-)
MSAAAGKQDAMDWDDYDLVLAAVKQNGRALQSAGETCKSDRDIVLAAVKSDGLSLRWAAESCRCDREIVLAAVEQKWLALQYAASELLEDSDFAANARQRFHILKITAMSGKSCLIAATDDETTASIIESCCHRLGLPWESSGAANLIHGDEVVPRDSLVHHWTWLAAPRSRFVVEFQLVVQTR